MYNGDLFFYIYGLFVAGTKSSRVTHVRNSKLYLFINLVFLHNLKVNVFSFLLHRHSPLRNRLKKP